MFRLRSRYSSFLCNRALAVAYVAIIMTVGGFGMTSQGSYAVESEVPLIPLEVLLGNPDKVAPNLSPDGTYLTYIAPLEGVLNVWIKTVGFEDDKPLTTDTGRGVTQYFWSYNCEQVCYLQDKDGDENWRIYVKNIKTGESQQLADVTSDDGHPIQARIMDLHRDYPDEMYIGLNQRDARVHDVYKVNMRTGELKLVQQSQLGISGWLFDNDFALRGYSQMTAAGGAKTYLRDSVQDEFELQMEIAPEDIMTTGIFGFAPDNKTLYAMSSVGRNAAALVEYDPISKAERILVEDPVYDVSGVSIHPTEHYIEAVTFSRDRDEWQVLDDRVRADFTRLNDPDKGDFGIVNRTLADDRWLVYYLDDDGPVSYYEYNRNTGELNFMFVHREALKDLPLVKMNPIQFETRDGLTVHGYLSLPLNWQGPGPLVLNVHGGPWYRDSWGFHPEAQ